MSAVEQLVLSGAVSEQVDLGPLVTYKFGGPARWFVEPSTEPAVAAAIDAAVADGVDYLVVGRGSNLVISDDGFDGLVVHLVGPFAEMSIDATGVVSAGAAMPLPRLARSCAKAGRGGLEFLVAVPGSVGGAIRMNAGCHGSDTGEWLIDTDVYRPGHGVMTVSRTDMEMGYRHNSLPESDVVLRARFRTEDRATEESEQVMREITQWRRDHQPGGTFNAGSVFKNPGDTAAGWLIDRLGLKGLAIGGARVSPRHANFFEAEPATRAQDIYDLVMEVKRRVRDAYGVDLEPEIRFVGAFADEPASASGPEAE